MQAFIMQRIFDRRVVFERFARLSFDPLVQNTVLKQIAEDMSDYLIFFGHSFNKTINILCIRQLYYFEEVLFKKNFQKDINIEFFNLEIDDNQNLQNLQNLQKYDAIIAFNCLHNVNFLEDYIKCFYSLLNENGIFCGNFYGTNTLKSLKEIIINNDILHSNNIYPRFNPTIRSENVSSILQNFYFKDITVLSNILQYNFENFKDSVKFLKSINERCYIYDRQKTIPNRKIFQITGNGCIDLEIIEFFCHK